MRGIIFSIRVGLGRILDVADILARAVRQPNVICDLRASVRRTRFASPNAVYGLTRVVNCVVGRHSYFGKGCDIENVTVGSFCSIGPRVMAGLGRHPTRGWISTAPCFFSPNGQSGRTFTTESKFEERRPIKIGHDVWIGAGAIILDGISIGSGAIVGAGSVVTKDVPPYSICSGVPATHLRYRFDEASIARFLRLQWWDWTEEKLRRASGLFSYDEKNENALNDALSALERLQ